MFVDTRTRLSQVTAGIAVESNIASQVEAVREALLGGPQLTKVAQAAIPSFAAASPAQKAAIIDNLRTKLTVEANGSTEPAGGSVRHLLHRSFAQYPPGRRPSC